MRGRVYTGRGSGAEGQIPFKGSLGGGSTGLDTWVDADREEKRGSRRTPRFLTRLPGDTVTPRDTDPHALIHGLQPQPSSQPFPWHLLSYLCPHTSCTRRPASPSGIAAPRPPRTDSVCPSSAPRPPPVWTHSLPTTSQCCAVTCFHFCHLDFLFISSPRKRPVFAIPLSLGLAHSKCLMGK